MKYFYTGAVVRPQARLWFCSVGA